MISRHRSEMRAVIVLVAVLLCSITFVQSAAAADETEPVLTASPLAYLVQLTEAALAPAWGSGGYSYIMDGRVINATSTLRPVCIRTRVSTGTFPAPFTFSMFDTQFSSLYLVDADQKTAHAVGQLSLQQSCYISTPITSTTTTRETSNVCMAVLFSDDALCAAGSGDALRNDWRAADLQQQPSQAPNAGARGGLTGAELFSVFVNDFLPQRAWLRTAVPRSLDVLQSALQARRAFPSNGTASLVLEDADEVADMQLAITSEWNRYVWDVYGPQLRRKWDLIYEYAVVTLTPGATAPPIQTTASVTGVPGPTNETRCPLVDAWMRLRHDPAQMSVTGLSSFISAALMDLSAVLHSLTSTDRNSSSSTVTGAEDRVVELLRAAYCVTTTHLFAMTALVDRPFLRAVASVWVEAANNSDSWAWQTMQAAPEAASVLAEAAAFQSAAAAHVAALSSTVSTAVERSLIACLATFLDPATPRTSPTLASPTDCVRVFVEAREADTAGAAVRPTTLFDLDTLTADAVGGGGVPGVTRFVSTASLPSPVDGDVEALTWTVVQESALPFTAQSSTVTPFAVPPTTDADQCTSAATAASPLHDVAWAVGYTCAPGTYVLEGTATCATCPAACARLSAPTPVYCPGDGVMHGCPARPPNAVFAGSLSGGQNGAASVCRYACANALMAPMNFSCVAVVGMFFNTTAAGNLDAFNGGGLSPCEGPASLFPPTSAVRLLSRFYALVGSGATDAPRTCAFSLMHRATSSLVSLRALQRVGMAPPWLLGAADDGSGGGGSSIATGAALASSSTASGTAEATTPLLSAVRSGVTWDMDVQLNATLLYAMHRDRCRAEASQAGPSSPSSTVTTTTTTIAHELIAVQRTPGSSGDAERVLSWYLVSTSNETDDAAGPSPLTSFSLQLLLNASVPPSPAAPASSLVVVSATWTWVPFTSSASPPLLAASYRAVLRRATNTVAFYVNGTTPLGTPVVVDAPLWGPPTTAPELQPDAAASLTRSASFFLSVGGWVAGYEPAQQWSLATTSQPTSISSAGAEMHTWHLPLFYDYVPGAVTRVASSATLLDALADTLQVAEEQRHAAAAAAAAAEGERVVQLTSVADLAAVTAATPLVTANVSAALNALALRSSTGLDGMCRPGYGSLLTSVPDAACGACVVGSYTAMHTDAAATGARRSVCMCVPQRVQVVRIDPAAGQRVTVCQRRPAGPPQAQAGFRPHDTLFLDADVTVVHNNGSGSNAAVSEIPLGWYATAGATAMSTTSLATAVTCLFNLSAATTTPATAANVDESASHTSRNLSVAMQYTTGLGGEACVVRAAARSGGASSSSSASEAAALISAPTYSSARHYALRLQAPALTAGLLTLTKNAALFADQTVLTVGVRGYALLTAYAVHSLLRMKQLTEYQLAYIAYVLRSATVAATLDCPAGSGGGGVRRLSWAADSALDTFVLSVNLTAGFTGTCEMVLRVTSASTAAREAALPFTTWPFSYLRVPASVAPTSFFGDSPELRVTLRWTTASFARNTAPRALREVSTFVIALCIAMLSLMLAFLHGVSSHAPSLHLLPWRRFSYERVKTLSIDDEP